MSNHTSHIFRPHFQPAQRIYDAIEDEALQRPKRTVEQWRKKEMDRALDEACKYAEENGLPKPTREMVELCERTAAGHTDYTAKWAYAIQRNMEAKPQRIPRRA